MINIQILWADDEIDSLKSHILFLKDKGYDVTPVTNGHDAIDAVKEKYFDIIFLDENMPGITGLEALPKIKTIRPQTPIVMITKSEEENIMEDAIGSQIADYLIKPVKPNQILLCLKKLIDNKRLVSEKTNSNFRVELRNMMLSLGNAHTANEWFDAYKNLIYWEMELNKSESIEMQEMVAMQKQEANAAFCKFISNNYLSWINDPDDETPTLSNKLLSKKVFPNLKKGHPTYLILIDNLRFDQWKMIEQLWLEIATITNEDSYFAILPTATQYARNAIFSGLMPLDVSIKYPSMWRNDEDEGGKNLFEEQLLIELIKRCNLNIKHSYTKITNHHDGKELIDNIGNLQHNDLNVIVYNFMDMLSHARTEMEVLKELANDEKAYRSITYSWFQNSPLLMAIKKLEGKNAQIILTTDHGSVRVNSPSKMIADKETTTNLRYKTGKSMQYNPKDIFEINNPHQAKLPKQHISSKYVFAKNDSYFVYANNYNHFANYYRNTFQHGGVSLEEMIVPIITLQMK
jgi:CheY-like chemotaxis protein